MRCLECNLKFVHPISLPILPAALFDSAYAGTLDESGLGDFAKRVEIRRKIIDDPSLWFWSPAFKNVIEWLRSNCGPRSVVLDVGCGMGFFMHALRREGFSPVGIDVAKLAVDLNTEDGFQVFHGTVDTVPQGWVAPAAVVALFMIHHVENPRNFFDRIRKMWPDAYVAVAAYGPRNVDPRRTLPPRTLTLWDRKSLSVGLSIAGYHVVTKEFTSPRAEGVTLRLVQRVSDRINFTAEGYRLLKRIERKFVQRLLLPFGREDGVVVAFGTPHKVPTQA